MTPMTPGDHHGQDADGQRHLAAVQDPGEQIAAQLVGAEQVAVGERRQQALGEVLVVGVRQRQEPGQHDGNDHQQGADDADPDLRLEVIRRRVAAALAISSLVTALGEGFRAGVSV